MTLFSGQRSGRFTYINCVWFLHGCAERRTENLGDFLSMSRKASTLVVREVVGGEGSSW